MSLERLVSDGLTTDHLIILGVLVMIFICFVWMGTRRRS